MKRTILSVFFILSTFLFASACNQTFEPLEENDKYFFTIFGYLDASADTQWVRIVPPREQIDSPPEVPEINVTLENLETGNTVVMKDSLFASGNGFNYSNFYTLEDIEAGQSYRVKAEHPDGRASQVTLKTPEEFPTPLFLEDFNRVPPRINSLFILGEVNLIDVQTWWYVRVLGPGRDQLKRYAFTYRNSAEWSPIYGGAYVVAFSGDEEFAEIRRQADVSPNTNSRVDVLYRQIYVAVAGPDWSPEIAALDDLLYSQPESLSNVENGLGYMVGVYSKIIPYETCHTEGRAALAPCEVEKPYW